VPPDAPFEGLEAEQRSLQDQVFLVPVIKVMLASNIAPPPKFMTPGGAPIPVVVVQGIFDPSVAPRAQVLIFLPPFWMPFQADMYQ
jgi:hypothetical protein